MEEAFKIYVDQLRGGQVEQIAETVNPKFLDIKEEDIRFDDISLQGEAYLAENDLIIRLNILTKVYIPCAICNAPVQVPMDLKNLYLTVEPDEFKSGVFYFAELLRESILLEMPHFAECNQGKCPQRKEIKKYLSKPEDAREPNGTDHGYHPFADLDFDEEAN